VIPTTPQIRSQIAAVLEREPDARVVALRAEQCGQWPESLEVGGRQFSVKWCDSPLAARLALRALRQDGEDGLALLTNQPAAALGTDVMARLARGRLFQLKRWDLLVRAFAAREVDARLAPLDWLADLLVEHMPTDGYPPVPGGVLDADTAWKWALQLACGLEAARPDLDTLLQWTQSPDGPRAFGSLPEKTRSGILKRLHDCTGAGGSLVLASLETGFAADVLPLGLLVDFVSKHATDHPDIAAAAVRLERFTGGRRIEQDAGRRWADAAIRVLRTLEEDHARHVLGRADQLAGELYLQPYVSLSDWLPSGFEARLVEFADVVSALAGSPNAEKLAVVERAFAAVRAHQGAVSAPGRIEKVEMATRVARWLATSSSESPGFEARIADYAAEGAYVDWARLKLMGGDLSIPVSRAFSELASRALERRETVNRSFAESLKAWNDTVLPGSSHLPVEQVLDRVVAPLSRHAPVLLLVVDGLSLPVLEELEPDVLRLGWSRLRPTEGRWAGVAVAALPTVTEISRASLLAGRLCSGTQANEKAAFASHEGLARARQGTPVLFHKGELSDGVALAPAVRAALSDSAQRVVGVVYNAIDDQLDGADQVHVRWTLEDLRLLPTLLHEARGAGRVIVLTADHGHVLEWGTTQRSGSGSDRWRAPDGELTEGEIRIEGGRVLTPAGGSNVTVPWSERVRYGGKKNGYHGGVTPQEVLVPLRVYAIAGAVYEGWQPDMPVRPAWWNAATAIGSGEQAVRRPVVVPAAPATTATGRPRDRGPTPDMFQPAVAPPPAAPQRDVLDRLFVSPTYQAQRALAARVAPPEDSLRRLLEALAERGGKLSIAAAAQRLGLPAHRMGGFLSASRRVLNVDQSAVLSIDETGTTIELNEALLRVQFQIEER